jgi:DNA repair exonuclease SbcCD ATPase subunit
MDKAIADINSQIRSCNSKIKMAENEIKDRSGELEETEWVDLAEKLANNLKGLKKRIHKKTEAFEKLHSYLSRVKELHWTITKNFQRLDEAKYTLKELKTDKQSIEQKKSDLNTLSELILNVCNVDSQLSVYADIQEATITLKQLNSLNARIFQYHGESDSISMLLTEIDANKEDMISAENDFIDAKTDYDAIWKEQKCPTCGRSESV